MKTNIEEVMGRSNRLKTSEHVDIRAASYPNCIVCKSQGTPLYGGVTDRISNAGGRWNYKRCSKAGCGLVWLDPMPLVEDIGKAYKQYFTHEESNPSKTVTIPRKLYEILKSAYLADKFGYPLDRSALTSLLSKVLLLPTRTSYIDFGVMHLAYRPQGRLLDFGCGAGATLEYLKRLGWNTEGIDFDPIVADKARLKGLEVYCESLEARAYNPNCFDAIVMSHVIEHVHEPLRLLAECRRILRPGGNVVVCTPNVESKGHRQFGDKWLYLDPPRHFHLFSKSALTEAAKQAGLKIVSVMTSSRTGARMSIGSRDIRKTGRHNASRKLSFVERIQGEANEWNEWFHCKIDSSAGEELVLIASKDESTGRSDLCQW